ncbi:MAG TPA: DUF1329 domain-containing protein [Candidatus Binataceae bacterium]|nr:DUF1329 domain-containing protein [Candidatus Binataceae bacterium]
MLRVWILGAALLIPLCTGAWAAEPGGIPAGTVITQENWQQYKDYMNIPLQHMFMSTSPVSGWPHGARAVVGPTISYPPPSAYIAATEKYSKQVKLVKVPNGSYAVEGYVAGQPFPNLDPSDPLAGYKLVYDFYYAHEVTIRVAVRYQVFDFDRYGNESPLHALVTNYQWMHNIDAGYPMNLPGANYYQSGVAEQLDPEQIKYITALTIVWDNPDRFPDAYVFLPSLRRSLRLSTNARCAPFQGQDFSNDDVTPVPLPPTWFKAEFSGSRRLLQFIFKPDPKTRRASEERANYYFTKGNFVPKDSLFGAGWQLRDTYILRMQRLPQYQRGYCYSDRVQYLDKESAENLTAYGNWDQNGKFWRAFITFAMPTKEDDGWYLFPGSAWSHDNCDYQSDHCSNILAPADGAFINHEVPTQYANRTLYGTPQGLQEIMR